MHFGDVNNIVSGARRTLTLQAIKKKYTVCAFAELSETPNQHID
jgi:hypothetical protein